MPYFDRFDICEAYYAFAMEWHSGQASELYSWFGRLDRMRFRPSPLFNGYESLSENGKEIYEALVERYGYTDEWQRQQAEAL